MLETQHWKEKTHKHIALGNECCPLLVVTSSNTIVSFCLFLHCLIWAFCRRDHPGPHHWHGGTWSVLVGRSGSVYFPRAKTDLH